MEIYCSDKDDGREARTFTIVSPSDRAPDAGAPVARYRAGTGGPTCARDRPRSAGRRAGRGELPRDFSSCRGWLNLFFLFSRPAARGSDQRHVRLRERRAIFTRRLRSGGNAASKARPIAGHARNAIYSEPEFIREKQGHGRRDYGPPCIRVHALRSIGSTLPTREIKRAACLRFAEQPHRCVTLILEKYRQPVDASVSVAENIRGVFQNTFETYAWRLDWPHSVVNTIQALEISTRDK